MTHDEEAMLVLMVEGGLTVQQICDATKLSHGEIWMRWSAICGVSEWTLRQYAHVQGCVEWLPTRALMTHRFSRRPGR